MNKKIARRLKIKAYIRSKISAVVTVKSMPK